jgi:hypothetical protein
MDDMKGRKKLYSFRLGPEGKLLHRLAKVERGQLNVSATLRRLIRDEAIREGLIKEEDSK